MAGWRRAIHTPITAPAITAIRTPCAASCSVSDRLARSKNTRAPAPIISSTEAM